MNPPQSNTQTSNPLRQLSEKYDQAVWLDYIRRRILEDGELKRLVDEDGLSGVTSNPAIFEKAIGGSDDYDAAIAKMLSGNADMEPGQLFERLAVEDIKHATQILAPVYKRTNGADGFVSIEVSPYLAYDTEKTIEEARRLWREVGQPNLMVKVPGTPQGLPAIQQLISEGININITLLFAQQTYKEVVQAYMAGLEERAATGGDISHIASVASFFVSRIDTMSDKQLAQKIEEQKDSAVRKRLTNLQGKVAIANAKLAYQSYLENSASSRWKALEAKGAKPQRLLWASTGTKNPAYSQTLYIDELIGKHTVNTMPPDTLAAFRKSTSMRESLTENIEQARQELADLAAAGISLDQITSQLVTDGVILFADAADKLLAAVARKRREILGSRLNTMSCNLGAKLDEAVNQALEDWRKQGNIRRLWNRDATLWTGGDESKWLDWLNVTAGAPEAAHWASGKFKYAVLLGMGGSSLGAEVLQLVFGGGGAGGAAASVPKLHVLDSTDPAQIKAVEGSIDYASTLFIVSSKSGTTLEPNLLKDYFFENLKSRGADAGRQFIAITDPGSALESLAKQDNFAHIYYGDPGIGGRYSVLSNFGMVPGAVVGADTKRLLDTTRSMVYSCGPSVPPAENPGVQLGAAMAVAAAAGIDKITVLTSPALTSFSAWLEQLFAESTGKSGHGLIPIAGETIASPEVYGDDRLFIYIKDGDDQPGQAGSAATGSSQGLDSAVAALEKAGRPMVKITVFNHYQLGQEFFRFEIATAVAGSIMGINAFNQPDVEASKEVARKLTAQYEADPQAPFLQPSKPVSAAQIKTFLHQINKGDYVALLAYLQRCPETAEKLQSIRQRIRQATRAATCLGFGPRFLHSTGQLYKGGPNTGVFLQITCDNSKHDLPIPGHKYTFGIVKTAQAQGDLHVLRERGRRVLEIHLHGSDIDKELSALEQTISEALSQ
jgi:transaldolase/glucose-6-phosphate isomerase